MGVSYWGMSIIVSKWRAWCPCRQQPPSHKAASHNQQPFVSFNPIFNCFVYNFSTRTKTRFAKVSWPKHKKTNSRSVLKFFRDELQLKAKQQLLPSKHSTRTSSKWVSQPSTDGCPESTPRSSPRVSRRKQQS